METSSEEIKQIALTEARALLGPSLEKTKAIAWAKNNKSQRRSVVRRAIQKRGGMLLTQEEQDALADGPLSALTCEERRNISAVALSIAQGLIEISRAVTVW